MNEDSNKILCAALTMIVVFVACIFTIYLYSSMIGGASAVSADRSNFETSLSVFPLFHAGTRSFEENETYLKYTFDSNMNADQVSINRGIDFSKCYSKDNKEINDAVVSDVHYVKIRGDTPDEALKTLSFPGVQLNAGFSIPDPSKLYVSKFKQVSPNEYKIWVITKTPSVETIGGALERTCNIGYWY